MNIYSVFVVLVPPKNYYHHHHHLTRKYERDKA